MEGPVEKTPSERKHTGSRVCSQRASFEPGHASTVLLITPRAGLLTAHLDGVVEWEVFSSLFGFCDERMICVAQCEKSGKRVIFEVA
jgi:hypothetical protein